MYQLNLLDFYWQFKLLLYFNGLDGGLCCYAMTATCLACNRGENVSDYCKMNPATAGCPPSGNL